MANENEERKKICFKQIACGPEPQPLSNFYHHRQMGDGHLNKCIACTKMDTEIRRKHLESTDPEWVERERLRHIEKAIRQKDRLQKTPKFRQWHKKAETNWMQKNPGAKRAHGIVKKAVDSGELIRPSKCQRCRRPHSIIEAHHADYSKPLDIEWLCKLCHVVVTFDEKRLAKRL